MTWCLSVNLSRIFWLVRLALKWHASPNKNPTPFRLRSPFPPMKAFFSASHMQPSVLQLNFVPLFLSKELVYKIDFFVLYSTMSCFYFSAQKHLNWTLGSFFVLFYITAWFQKQKLLPISDSTATPSQGLYALPLVSCSLPACCWLVPILRRQQFCVCCSWLLCFAFAFAQTPVVCACVHRYALNARPERS